MYPVGACFETHCRHGGGQHEGAAAVRVRHHREPPDVPEADRRADGGEDEGALRGPALTTMPATRHTPPTAPLAA